MEIVVGVSLLIALLAIIASFNRGQSQNNPKNPNPENMNTFDYSNWEDKEHDEGEEYDIEPGWDTMDFDWGPQHRPEGFVGLPGLMNIRLAGSNIPQRNAEDFIQSAKPKEARIQLDRQTDNPHDTNAIAVFGIPYEGGQKFNLGFIPRPIALKIRSTYSDDMPLIAEPRRVGVHNIDYAVFVTINVLGPNATKRKKYQSE